MKPIIGLTAGEIVNKEHEWSPITYGQSHTYVDAIIHAGGIPVILPLSEDIEVLQALYARCDGLLLSGGNDIDPTLYGASDANLSHDISKRRDAQELQFIEWAMEDDKPLLGICRGMQILNVAQGGTLYQDLPTDLPDSHNHTISSQEQSVLHIAHQLRIDPSSRLASIVESDALATNAHHHQAVRKVGDGVIATAWAEDGVIEAIEMPAKRFIMAVQSHPESLEAQAVPRWRKLFAAFVASCNPQTD